MGKKGGWFSTVKKALRAQSNKEKIKKKKSKSKNSNLNVVSSSNNSEIVVDPPPPTTPLVNKDDEKKEHDYDSCVAIVTTSTTSEPTIATADQTVTNIYMSHSVGKIKEENAAIKIQNAFREYLNQHNYLGALATSTTSDQTDVEHATKVVHPTTMSPSEAKSKSKDKDEIAAIKIQTAFRGYLNKQDCCVALATPTTIPSVATAQATTEEEVVHLTNMSPFVGKSNEEIAAAIKIQIAFRGYLTRRAVPQAKKGLMRLKSFIEGQSIKRQAKSTLKFMRSLSSLQPKSRTSQRIKISKEDQNLQLELQNHERKLEKLKIGEVWDDSPKSKEQIEANLHNKQEAAVRRERALAYAFTHKLKKNSKNSSNSHWGRSLSEKWRGAGPREVKGMAEKDFNNHGPMKRFNSLSINGEN